ncbi:hypothetical protein DRJ25_04755 [Candidatus Woesearchaeota archaeon]|nr:MAG: hypothetical protein DRJ25_04755 [Candidatus Woesearchaeota archaeon]
MQKRTCIIMLMFLILLFVQAGISLAQEEKINVYFFYGKGCPHCAHEKPFLEELRQVHPEIKINSYEVWYNKDNARFFKEFAKAFKTKISGVPATFIDDKVWVGYSESVGEEIKAKVKKCLTKGCTDAINKLKSPSKPEELNIVKSASPLRKLNTTINIPILGKIDTKKISLPVFTIILAGLDSFNPCAFFVLLFLLSMLIYAKSKSRMLLIGGVFVFFSGLIYFIFMAAWLNIFIVTGELKIVTTIAAAIAIFIGIVNAKDFFYFKKGITLSIPEDAKPTLFHRMRNLLKATSMISMLLGTIALAITANLYELLCTAGFPMVFTRILTLNKLSTLSYYLYLLLYNVVYIIPLLAIVIVFTITLGAKRLGEEGGKNLKLISGIMMLALGIVLMTNPALMNNVFVSICIVAGALALAGTIILLSKGIRTCKTAIEESKKCRYELKEKETAKWSDETNEIEDKNKDKNKEQD